MEMYAHGCLGLIMLQVIGMCKAAADIYCSLFNNINTGGVMSISRHVHVHHEVSECGVCNYCYVIPWLLKAYMVCHYSVSHIMFCLLSSAYTTMLFRCLKNGNTSCTTSFATLM